MNKVSHSKIAGATVAGVLQIVFGVCLFFVTWALWLFQLLSVFDFLRGFVMMFRTGSNITMLICIIGGIAMIWRGVSNLSLAGRAGRVNKALGNRDRQKIEVLARALGCSQDRAVNQIRTLVARGYWQHAYFDLEAKEFVVGVPPQPEHPDDPQDETILREVKVRSAMPLILAGAVWVVYALLPQTHSIALWMVIVASVLVYSFARKAMPPRIKVVEERIPAPKPAKAPKPETGNKAVDDNLSEAYEQITAIERIGSGVANQRLQSQSKRLVQIGREILEIVGKNPDKLRHVRQFLNYYLPTTLKLLESYRELAGQSVKGENITETMEKVEGIMDSLVQAYERELDDLFKDKAIDISADIQVMQDMIRQGGLADDFFGKTQQ